MAQPGRLCSERDILANPKKQQQPGQKQNQQQRIHESEGPDADSDGAW